MNNYIKKTFTIEGDLTNFSDKQQNTIKNNLKICCSNIKYK